MAGQLILVTGASSFLGGHVIHEALKAGYRVRGTVRGDKVNSLRDAVKLPGVEFTQVDDVATSDLTAALKDVNAVVHVASPLPGKASVDETINSAVEGTLNVLRQTVKAGIHKVVITSTFGNVIDPSLRLAFAGLTLTDDQWGEVTREEIDQNAANPFYVYFASKLLAEKAAFDFGKENPQLDVRSILTSFLYGPYADNFPLPANQTKLGTNNFILGIMAGGQPPQPPPYIVDVRDSARAHILALGLPEQPGGYRRYFVHGGNLSWKQAAAHINKVFPDVKTASQESFPDLPGPPSKIDTTRTQQELKIGELRTPEVSIEAVVSALSGLLKTWNA